MSQEAPGLLDYEADGQRAVERFTKELDGLSKDTSNLGRILGKLTKEFEKAEVRTNPTKKQRKANQAAKAIDRSAIYIERRAELLRVLAKDVTRNYRGAIEHLDVSAEDDRNAARALMSTLDDTSAIGEEALGAIRNYGRAVKNVHDQNLSRSVRIATGRLAAALDAAAKALNASRSGSRELSNRVRRRLGE